MLLRSSAPLLLLLLCLFSLAVANDHCQVRNDQGNVAYDLSALSAVPLVTKDPQGGEVLFSVCGAPHPPGQCTADQAIAYQQHGTECFNLGNSTMGTLKPGPNGINAVYTGGDVCANGKQREFHLQILCDPSGDAGAATVLSVVDEQPVCTYHVSLSTVHACPNPQPDSCVHWDASGKRYDLSALRGRVYNAPTGEDHGFVGFTLCKAIEPTPTVCAKATGTKTMQAYSTNRHELCTVLTDFRRESWQEGAGSLTLAYASASMDAGVDVHLVCDPSVDAKVVGQADSFATNFYDVTLATKHACAANLCSVTTPSGAHLDFSPIAGVALNVSDQYGNDYIFTVCDNVVSRPSTCNIDAQSFQMNPNGFCIPTGLASQPSWNATDTAVTVTYGGGAVCGFKPRSFSIEFSCDPNNEFTPVGHVVESPVGSCQYHVKATSKYACTE